MRHCGCLWKTQPFVGGGFTTPPVWQRVFAFVAARFSVASDDPIYAAGKITDGPNNSANARDLELSLTQNKATSTIPARKMPG